MEHEIQDLDAAGLRTFALQVGGIIAVLFGLFFPWVFDAAWPVWPWVLGGGLIAWGLIAPGSLGPVYRGWMRFGLLLNRVVSPVVLGVLFFVMLTPVAAVMRLLGRDAMSRRIDPQADTYREPSRRTPARNMEKPF